MKVRRHSSAARNDLGSHRGYRSNLEIYYSEMLLQKTRIPTVLPSGSVNKEQGVAIGDIGSFTPQGIFERYFNVFLDADDPANARCPEGFVPMQRDDNMSYEIMEDCNSTCEYVFRCGGLSGAVLALPSGSHRRELREQEKLRQYAIQNAETWYAHILSNGDVFLVTGHESAQSFGMAWYSENRQPFRIKFQRAADQVSYHWTPIPGEPGTVSNHVVFLRGWSISLGPRVLARTLGLVADTSSLTEFESNLGAFPLSCIHSNNKPQLSNPSVLINEYLLRKVPDAVIIFSHDNDWCTILENQIGMYFTIHTETSMLTMQFFLEKQSDLKRGVDFSHSKFPFQVEPIIMAMLGSFHPQTWALLKLLGSSHKQSFSAPTLLHEDMNSPGTCFKYSCINQADVHPQLKTVELFSHKFGNMHANLTWCPKAQLEYWYQFNEQLRILLIYGLEHDAKSQLPTRGQEKSPLSMLCSISPQLRTEGFDCLTQWPCQTPLGLSWMHKSVGTGKSVASFANEAIQNGKMV
ncbi:hypothetical protein R3P38DRAFT_2839110 [Favolaschia claudopus]|uniref:Uncharacterized protein n=1 Tax=Favolaschia claudopus TaxID=2862362 RepID=A0AAW0E880_9AGAR